MLVTTHHNLVTPGKNGTKPALLALLLSRALNLFLQGFSRCNALRYCTLQNSATEPQGVKGTAYYAV